MVTGSAVLGLASAPAGAAAQPASEPVRAVKAAVVEGITEYTLPNGLSVILFPDASKPTATVNMTYKVGSRNESYGETGMAHLLEHLMFKGSKNFPPRIPHERIDLARPHELSRVLYSDG